MRDLCDILRDSKTIAVVGLSGNPIRTSRRIADFLLNKGCQIVGVNPTIENAGDIKIYPNLRDVPFAIDIVDVFRRSEDIPELIPDVLAVRPKVLWLQSGIYNDKAVRPVIEAGIETIQDTCIYVSYNSCF
jgi:predicted CoA-binding protein